ncbi:MAG: alpha-glucuronidase, partial [Lachnospiraceae bacterium]|nr:alpha-glucuronidase [Lachnospiraceae bacterium]
MGFEQAWLSYEKKEVSAQWADIHTIYAEQKGRIIEHAAAELQTAFAKITGKELMLCLELPEKETNGCILLKQKNGLKEGGYHLFEREGALVIEAPDEGGLLYGAFELIKQLQLGNAYEGMDICKEPVMPLRMLNHWDNMDGSIERGYSGNSFFFDKDEILVDERIVTYARLLASVGINGTVINNVNVKDAATWLITDRYFEKLRQLSEILADYGIKLFLSLNYAAPVELGELDSADPLSEEVRAWWKERMKLVFTQVPNLGGFLIKADSEGRPGPFTYGRTHADGANMLAEAAEPYGG